MTLGKTTILLVDDNSFVLTAMSKVLQKEGFLVYTCESWPKIATFVRRILPDLLLLDYKMPGLKGDQICKILRENSPKEGMKIVFFSAEQENLLKQLVTECGADGYIRKKVETDEIIKEIRSYLNESDSDLSERKKIERPNIPRTILLVDDSVIFRRICREIIKTKYVSKIIEAENGLECINILHQNFDIDLVMLDINMPIMNGILVLEKLHEERAITKAPILICSTEGREDDILRGLTLGARGYIIKPFPPDALFAAFSAVLKEARSD